MPKTGKLVLECVIVSSNQFSIPIRCLGSPRTLGYLFILTVFSEVSYFNVISHRWNLTQHSNVKKGQHIKSRRSSNKCLNELKVYTPFPHKSVFWFYNIFFKLKTGIECVSLEMSFASFYRWFKLYM